MQAPNEPLRHRNQHSARLLNPVRFDRVRVVRSRSERVDDVQVDIRHDHRSVLLSVVLNADRVGKSPPWISWIGVFVPGL